MKGLSAKEIVLPIVVVLIAIVLVSIFSVNVLRGLKTECEVVQGELASCLLDVTDRTEKLQALYDELDLTEKDIAVYDQIYRQKQTEAELLEAELIEEQSKPTEQKTCVVPYRSVPDYKAFGKVWRMEMILERLDNSETYLTTNEFIRDDDLHHLIGQLHFASYDFQTIFLENGYTNLPKDQKAQEWYNKNSDLMEELSQMYLNFDEFNNAKTKTRVSQILKSQRSIIQGMQERYFI